MRVQTLEEVMLPYRHYPKRIQNALLRVETHPSFRALSKTMVRVLKAFVTRAGESNGMRVLWARLDKIATEAQCSTKSCKRTLEVLKEIGWIRQVSEGRSEHGIFCARNYQFTAPFCELVQLPVNGIMKEECLKEIEIEGSFDIPAALFAVDEGEAFWGGRTKMSDGPIYIDLSLQKDQQKDSFRKRTSNPTPVTLTPALDAMVAETSIKDSGIAKLRGAAHSVGYNLEDVYLVAKERFALIKPTASRAYRYLMAMITNPKRTNFKAKADQILRLKNGKQLQSKTSSHRNTTFKASNGSRLKVFDGTAELIRPDGKITLFGGTQLNDFYDRIERGEFVRVDEPLKVAAGAMEGTLKAQVGMVGSRANIAASLDLLRKAKLRKYGLDSANHA